MIQNRLNDVGYISGKLNKKRMRHWIIQTKLIKRMWVLLWILNYTDKKKIQINPRSIKIQCWNDEFFFAAKNSKKWPLLVILWITSLWRMYIDYDLKIQNEKNDISNQYKKFWKKLWVGVLDLKHTYQK